MANTTDFKMRYVIDADASKAKSTFADLDKQIGGVSSTIGSLGGLSGTAIAGALTGIAAAGTAVAASLFGLTKAASDFGSQIHDASIKTGLGAESISALKLAADQSGTSLEQVTGGIAKFAKTVGAAGDGSKEAAAKLKSLGIEPIAALNDLDGSLDKVFKRIGAARPGIEQITLAQKAFGKAGADLIPLMEQTGYNFEAFRKHAEELGITMSDKDAAAADQFGDQMTELEAQLAGVGRVIGMELMPTFLGMANEISDWLTKNKGQIEWWAGGINAALKGVIWQWKMYGWAAKQAYELAAHPLAPMLTPPPTLDVSSGTGGRVTEGRGGQRLPSSFDPSDGGKSHAASKAKVNLPAFGSMTKLVISTGNAQWDAWFAEAGKKFGVDPNVLLLQAGAESSYKAGAVSPKGAQGFSQIMPGTAARFGVNTSSIKDSIRGQAQYMGVLLSMFGGDYEKALAGYNAGEGNVQKYGGVPPFKETRSYVSKIKGSYAGRVKKSDAGGYGTYDQSSDDQKAAEDEIAGATKAWEEFQDFEKQRVADSLDVKQAEASQAVEILQKQLREQMIDEVDYADRVGQLHVDQLQEERDEVEKLTPTRENLHRLQVLDLEIETARVKKENDVADAIERQNQAFLDQLDAIGGLQKKNPRPGTLKKRGEGSDLQDFDIIGAFDPDKIKDATKIAGEQMKMLKDMTNDTFHSMADAIGQSIAGWALYGDSIGASLQKATAAILANLAAQAITQAIWETAQGFAMLALSFIGHPGAAASAAAHFQAAAIYAGVGVGAALGARAIGGGGKGAAGGAGAGSGSSYNPNAGPSTYSRVSPDAFMSGGRNSATSRLADAVEKLHDKVDRMSPGDVLARGVKQRPGLVGDAVVSDIRRDAGTGRKILASAGVR